MAINKVNLFHEPRKSIKSKYSIEKVEMNEFESAFLCGLLRDRKPRKIVEVGVAAGGTTAIILECLREINAEAKVYSIDLMEEYYKDSNMQTGFLADEAKKTLPTGLKHEMLLGDILPNRLDRIGKGIDFLILDTMHVTPGEILDFLVAYPYLSHHACVVLHDVALSQYSEGKNSWCTQLLFDSVTADKIIMTNDAYEFQYPNIAAFEINDDTGKYMKDMLHCLSIPWSYMPETKELLIYRDFMKKEYPSDFIELFDIVVGLNKKNNDWHNFKYELGTKIDFSKNGRHYFLSGVNENYEDLAWSTSKMAAMRIDLPQKSDKELHCSLSVSNVLKPGMSIVVHSGGAEVCSKKIVGATNLKFKIPLCDINSRTLELYMDFPDACTPASLGVNSDMRTLSMAFKDFMIY